METTCKGDSEMKGGKKDWEDEKRNYDKILEDLLDDQNKLIDRVSELTKQGKSAENEITKLVQQKNAIEVQRKETNERLKFSEIVIKCMRGKYKGGNCENIYDNIMKDLKMLSGNFFVIVYYGNCGGNNWGYCLIAEDPYFSCHEWDKDGYCYVIKKINYQRSSTVIKSSDSKLAAVTTKKKLNTFDNDIFSSLVERYYQQCSGNDLINIASYIYDSLTQNYIRPLFVIVKAAPGSYDRWCYGPINGNLSGYYHKWHDSKNWLGITYGSWCVGAQC